MLLEPRELLRALALRDALGALNRLLKAAENTTHPCTVRPNPIHRAAYELDAIADDYCTALGCDQPLEMYAQLRAGRHQRLDDAFALQAEIPTDAPVPPRDAPSSRQ